LFFRGKAGISKLREFLDRDEPASSAAAAAADSVAAFARLEQLRAQKRDLEEKRPLIFADRALDDAILAIDHEISRLSERLRAMARRHESD
jgi:acetyl-CoA carboxylase carboxyltransferase component